MNYFIYGLFVGFYLGIATFICFVKGDKKEDE